MCLLMACCQDKRSSTSRGVLMNAIRQTVAMAVVAVVALFGAPSAMAVAVGLGLPQEVLRTGTS